MLHFIHPAGSLDNPKVKMLTWSWGDNVLENDDQNYFPLIGAAIPRKVIDALTPHIKDNWYMVDFDYIKDMKTKMLTLTINFVLI